VRQIHPKEEGRRESTMNGLETIKTNELADAEPRGPQRE
jgi:hypothetical protein